MIIMKRVLSWRTNYLMDLMVNTPERLFEHLDVTKAVWHMLQDLGGYGIRHPPG